MKIIPIQLRIIFLFVLSLNLIYSCKKDDSPTTLQPTSIELSESTVSLVVGGREKLLVSFEPADADLSQAKWVSSDTNIVKVDNSGIVTAIAAGSATVIFSTANNLSKQCSFTVVQSPVSGIVLPMANYPIGNGLKFIIQGTGFSESNKIWFRKASYSNTGFKSTQDGDDILGEIHEIAGNYINVSGGATNGWYSVYLEDDGNMFNLGNLEFSTYQVPAFVYDPNKIFWDDTHWRRFQLRGKVKEMKTNEIYFPYWSHSSSFTFNDKGFLEASMAWSYPTSYQYDSQNRLVNKTEVLGVNFGNGFLMDRVTCKYFYGNHSLYIPIPGSDAQFPHTYSQPFYDGSLYYQERFDFMTLLKGLEKVEIEEHFEDNSTMTCVYLLNVFSDSVTCDYSSPNYSIRDSKFLWKFINGFPTEYREDLFIKTTGQWEYTLSSSYNYNTNGMPSDFNRTFTDDSGIRSYGNGTYIPSCPFNIYTDFSSPNNSGITLGYDQNWDITSYKDDYKNIGFYYTSYDAHGNWTQCYVINTEWTGHSGISILTRDFTYWE